LHAQARRLGVGNIRCVAWPGLPLDRMLAELLPRAAGVAVVCGGSYPRALADKLRLNMADADTF
jgi:hypothetical protein